MKVLVCGGRADLWYIRGGPKNGGRFGYLQWCLPGFCRFEIGSNHRPMTRNARERASRLRWPKFGRKL